MTRALVRFGVRVLGRLDAAFNRLFTWKHNPLYHSGAVAVVSLVILLITGLYLLIFYRIGSPYESVEAITGQAWSGRWIRTLHRYASDVAVVAVLAHAFRMFAQGRSWGPRTLAWLSGLALTFLLLVCGWTGYVMVWDVQAQLLAVEGARFLDVLPLFSEPIARAFTGEGTIPGAFFFLNLFAHIALPVGLALVLWIHVSRVSRPALLPPRGLLRGTVGALLVVSIVWPVGMAAEADLFRVPSGVPLDVFYGFFLPVTQRVPAWTAWLVTVAVASVLALVPRFTRPSDGPRPSSVEERFCTGCEQCYVDCPYEAISMVARSDGRAGLVARVDPALCVSCGICAGSCAPMGVGPPGRTGRDQLADVRAFLDGRSPGPEDVVVIACDRGSGGVAAFEAFLDAAIFPVGCAGSLHTSVVELLVRSGAGGVLVVSCPPRDCWNREGVKWLEQRMYHDREAELKPRVDRERVRLVHVAAGERDELAREIRAFQEHVRALARARAQSDIALDLECAEGDRPLASLEVEP